MQMQLAELHIQLNTSSQTTQTNQDLGAVSKETVRPLPLLVKGCIAAQ